MNKFFYAIALASFCNAVFVQKTAAQCVLALSCPPPGIDSICDASVNNPQYWNEGYWLDSIHGSHDLPEGAADLCFTAIDTCTGIAPTLRYQLLLDLDGDDVAETLIDSDDLPPANTVFFNNLNNPSNDMPRSFDERGLNDQYQWRFTLETAVSGASTTACVRWNNAANPGAYIAPELPHGRHRIRWIAVGSAGDTSVCERVFRVRDCAPPTVVCLPGLSVNVLPWGLITLWSTDFLQYAVDNVTPPTISDPSNQLEFGIRRTGFGTGFPPPFDPNTGTPNTSVTFTCDNSGTYLVDLWARDKAGNADSCQAYVIVQDPFCNCDCAPVSVVVCIKNHCAPEGVAGVSVALNATHPALPPIYMDEITNSSGCAGIPNALPIAADYTLTPAKDDNPMNGVSTFDLVLMSKHILGITPLNSPYKIIAADVNKSNSVTTFDIVELRKLILGLYSELPNNSSWRFIDADFQFADPLFPFQSAPFPESITVQDVQVSQFDDEFVGIKIGDLSCDAVSNAVSAAEAREPALLIFSDRLLTPGETVEIPVRVAETAAWLGFQLALQADANTLEIEQILPSDLSGLDAESFAQPRPGLLTASWFDARPQPLASETPLFTLRVRALRAVRLRDALALDAARLLPEAYETDARRRGLALIFLENAAATPGSEIAIFPVQPNPIPNNQDAILLLRLSEAATLQIEIADLTGKILFSNTLRLEAGFQILELPASALPGAGLYFWRLAIGEKMFAGRLLRF